MTLKIKSALLWHSNRCFCGISVGVFAAFSVVQLESRNKPKKSIDICAVIDNRVTNKKVPYLADIFIPSMSCRAKSRDGRIALQRKSFTIYSYGLSK